MYIYNIHIWLNGANARPHQHKPSEAMHPEYLTHRAEVRISNAFKMAHSSWAILLVISGYKYEMDMGYETTTNTG